MSESETLSVFIERSGGTAKYRQYHIRGRICDIGCEIFELPMNLSLLKDSDVGFRGYELIKRLNELDGIDKIYIRPFCLTVKKSPVFDWEELEADILFAFESVFERPVEVNVG